MNAFGADVAQWWRDTPALATQRAHRLCTGTFFIASGVMILLGTLWLNGASARVGGMASLGTVAVLLGAAVLWRGERLSLVWHHAAAVLAALTVSCAVLLSSGGAESVAIGSMYVFVIVHVVFLFPLRYALGHIAITIACQVSVLLHTNADLGDMLILGGSTFVVGGMVAWLARAANAAEQDPLTGLLSRRGLDRRLAEGLDRVRRDGGSLVMAILDLDYFRSINEALHN